MKHERGTRGVALAFDAAGRSNAQGTPLPMRPAASRHVMPRGFHVLFADASQRGSDTGRFARYRADSGLNRPYRLYRPKRSIQAEIQKKKKKGAERIVRLISKPYFSPVSHKRQNISSSPHIDLDDEEVGV